MTDADRAIGTARTVPPPELLDWAAHGGDVDAVRRLLAAGADVDGGGTHHPPDGSTLGAALHGALRCGHAEGGPTTGTVDEIDHGSYAEVARILLSAGAPVPDRADEVLARLWISQTTAPSSGSQSSSSSS